MMSNIIDCERYGGEDEDPILGWAVFYEQDDSDPRFEAFFPSKKTAERFLVLMLTGPGSISPAFIDETGMIVANDIRCETPEQLHSSPRKLIVGGE